MTITDVVFKLIGKVKPVGESNEDSIRYENLQNLCLLTSDLIEQIKTIANSDSYEYSNKKASELAKDFL